MSKISLMCVTVLMLTWLALATLGASSVSVSPPLQVKPVRSVVIPNFVGMKACHARRIAQESLLRVRPFPGSRCDAVVVAQRPAPHTLIAGPRAAHTVVKFRLRG